MSDRQPGGQPWPRVSIVTPSYNQGRFIEETIRSVLLQGYPDLQYLVIDGGSEDETLDVIRRYEPWLTYWTSEPDRGQAHAINKGWTRATGDIVAYINTDDSYLIGAIPAVVPRFTADPGLGMAYGTAMIVNEWGEELREWQARPFDLRAMFASGNVVPQPAAFFSSAALTAVGRLDEQWQLILDYEFCIRVAMSFRSACVPARLARFRNHSASKTRTQFERMAGELTHFVKAFRTDQVSAGELQSIKRSALSRIQYELALAYLAREHRDLPRALNCLIRSVGLQPRFAFSQPRLTAHIGKEVLVGYIRAMVEHA